MRQLVREENIIQMIRNSKIPTNGSRVFVADSTAQKSPAEVEAILQEFHKYLLRVRSRGRYELSDIANMDQTGSSFIIDDGKTYDSKGSKDVWCKSGQSGLDKRQCTVQLTVFVDGVPPPRIKPLLIHSFFYYYKNLVYKNVEAEIWVKIKNNIRTLPSLKSQNHKKNVLIKSLKRNNINI